FIIYNYIMSTSALSLHKIIIDEIVISSEMLRPLQGPVINPVRSNEVKRLTNLLLEKRPFTFLRIGDMEMTALYGFQEGLEGEIDFGDGILEGTRAIGNPGLDKDMVGALWSAYEEADYIDYCDILLVNRKLRPK